jgi:DnaJ-class molecular chaperone
MAISNSTPLINSQLKSKYYELAKTCHPDLNPNDLNATEKFQKLQEQYKECLQSLKSNNKIYCVTIQISLQDSILGCTRYFSSRDEKRKFILKIPPGIINNDIIRYKNIQMDENLLSILEVKIIVDLPLNYSYKNGKLVYSVLIPFWKLFLGGEKVIIGPDKARLRILIPPKTKSGSIFELQNEGLLDKLSKKRDILYIRLKSSIFC